MQESKVDLASEIEELTRGAVVNEFLDRWTGKVRRVELGIKLALPRRRRMAENDAVPACRTRLRACSRPPGGFLFVGSNSVAGGRA